MYRVKDLPQYTFWSQNLNDSYRLKFIFQVISRIGEPYVTADSGNGTYKGFAVDLIDAVFKVINKQNNSINLKYKFSLLKDGGYGNPIEGTKKWNGLIGELLEHVSILLEKFR